MTDQFVVGLFESRGFALDALHRLRTEGVPESLMSLVVLHEIDPVPRSLDPELTALEVDPLVLGNVRESFADFIHNGETAVIVGTDSEADVQFAHDVMVLYAPLAVEVMSRRRTGQTVAVLRSIAISPAE